MADLRPLSVDRLPTLTEVLELGPEFGDPFSTAPAPAPVVVPWAELLRAMAARGAPLEATALVDEAAIVRRVLAELEPRVAATLESRLREAMAPALARAGETLIRETRDEIGAVARALVEESLAQLLREPPQG